MKTIYLALLIAEVVIWAIVNFRVTTSCGIGYLYKDVWFCNLLSSTMNIKHITTVLLLFPWIFFTIYGFRLIKKYQISKLEHSLVTSLFLMIIFFILYLAHSGFSG